MKIYFKSKKIKYWYKNQGSYKNQYTFGVNTLVIFHDRKKQNSINRRKHVTTADEP